MLGHMTLEFELVRRLSNIIARVEDSVVFVLTTTVVVAMAAAACVTGRRVSFDEIAQF